jgi:CheY-like chemotaxis protein
MQGAGKSAVSNGQMQLLLVGKNKDFSYLRDLLSQSGNGDLGLDYAHSTEDALARLSKTNYDLLICEYESGDGAALRLMHELRRNGPGAPVIFLSDHINEAAIDAALKTGTGDPAQASILAQPSLTRTIRHAISVYGKERHRQKTEDTLRKLWRAVEQSADLVMITDRAGMIEYVNPAFEALTGYSPRGTGGSDSPGAEVRPASSRTLPGAVAIHSLRQCVPLHHGEPEKEWRDFRHRESHHTLARRRRPDHALYFQ